MEDLQAIRMTLKGKVEAFEGIVRRYHKTVFRIAWRLVWNESEAEEIAQEVFMKTYRKLDQFDQSASFSPWINRITVNTACTHLRKRMGRGTETEFAEEIHRSGDPSPEKAAGDRMELKRVLHTISSLPEEYCAALTLRSVEGLSYKEIADRMECSIGTVMARLNRERSMMMERMRGGSSRLEAMTMNRIATIMTGAALFLLPATFSAAEAQNPGQLLDTAREMSLRGRFSDSRRLYRQVIAEFPRDLHDQALFWLAYSGEAEGDTKEAVSLYGQLAREFPKSVYADDALRKMASLTVAEKDYAGTVKALRTLVDRYGNSPYANEAQLDLGDIYGYRLSQFAAAVTAYRAYQPGEAMRGEVGWKAAFFDGNQDFGNKPLTAYTLGWRQREAEDLDGAEATLRKLIVDFPKALVVDDALVLLGRIAIDRAAKLRLDNPVMSEATRERFLGHYRSAADYFRQAMRDSVGGEAAAEAQYGLGLIYDWDRLGGLNDFEKARGEYRTVTKRYPGTYWAKKAEERLVTIESFLGR